MSYIDTFDHEFIGFFGDLPVYHPLQTVENDEAYPNVYNITPNNLIIGGGSGEHPALILRSLDYAVAQFITNWSLEIEEEKYANEKVDSSFSKVRKLWDEYLDDSIDKYQGKAFDFVGWNVKTYHAFNEMCTTKPARPYNPAKNGSFDTWLAACFGELIFFSMRDLIPNLAEKLPEAQFYVQEALYYNILLQPPGYPPQFGRIVKNNKVVWGVSHWWPTVDEN